MNRFDLLSSVSVTSSSKIVMLILDGLGGIPLPDTGCTELETAETPVLDSLARKGICGLIDPVSPGITPGSGPAHLALFGYDPLQYQIGRGVLEALGIDFGLKESDVAARGNFCTVDAQGLITDRRAGRIPTEKNAELCRMLDHIKIDDVEAIAVPVKEHRFVVVFRGESLSDVLTETDPQREGLPPKPAHALSRDAERTATIVNKFIDRARTILADQHPANMIMLRGFSKHPNLPSMNQVYKLTSAAIATYPMYRGLAKLVGMDVLPTGATIQEEFSTVHQTYDRYDFFYVHYKKTDAAGEDGDFPRKVKAIEEFDAALPQLLELNPDVLVITGDHSTPAALASHSWHPVPFLLYSKWCRPDASAEFSERACAGGSLGRFPSVDVMPLAMANALKMTKYGA